MTNEHLNALEKAKQLSIDTSSTKIAVLHLGGYNYTWFDFSDVPENETRIIAVFENGKPLSLNS